MGWRDIYEEKRRTAEEAVKIVRDHDRVYIGTASSIAYKLAEALYGRKEELFDVLICQGLTSRKLPFFMPDAKGHFSTLTYFVGGGERIGISNGQTVYTSLHLSQIDYWCTEVARPNVAFLEVSEPDDEGYMSFGAYGVTFGTCVSGFAEHVVLQVNPQVPYVYGCENKIHVSDAEYIVEAEDSLDVVPDVPFDETLKTISDYIVDEIPDGATIQLGLGGLSGAIGFGLKNKNDLGIHTEMLTDSMMELMKLGVINNKRKNFMPGKAVTAFAFGTRELYDFVDHNEDIYFAPYRFVNNPVNIAKNDNMISVNTAMAVDLYGQVVADCLGGKQQSATGGQLDYVRGAQMSRGGKSFIALPSVVTNKKGTSSRIVSSFPVGTAVTTPRSDVQYVVTEYGCVNLKSLSMADRARAMISLAHPDYRDELEEDAKNMGLL